MRTPTLVYDDDCGFCLWFVRRFLAYGEFDPVSFASLTDERIDGLPDDYRQCMHLVTDEGVYSCGEALEQVVVRTGTAGRWLTRLLRALPGWASLREKGYRWVADHRSTWGRYVSENGFE